MYKKWLRRRQFSKRLEELRKLTESLDIRQDELVGYLVKPLCEILSELGKIAFTVEYARPCRPYLDEYLWATSVCNYISPTRRNFFAVKFDPDNLQHINTLEEQVAFKLISTLMHAANYFREVPNYYGRMTIEEQHFHYSKNLICNLMEGREDEVINNIKEQESLIMARKDNNAN